MKIVLESDVIKVNKKKYFNLAISPIFLFKKMEKKFPLYKYPMCYYFYEDFSKPTYTYDEYDSGGMVYSYVGNLNESKLAHSKFQQIAENALKNYKSGRPFMHFYQSYIIFENNGKKEVLDESKFVINRTFGFVNCVAELTGDDEKYAKEILDLGFPIFITPFKEYYL